MRSTSYENIIAFDKSHIWHPYASIGTPPPVNLAIRASGTEIYLDNGVALTDAVSSWWCVAHGHCHPAIVEAIQRQAAKMAHVMFGGFTHEKAVELAERICAITPPGLNKIFFADSGSISVEVAVKMAIQYQNALGVPSRSHIVALKGGYHGDTVCAMSLSDPDGMHTLFSGVLPRNYFAEKPHCGFYESWDERDFDSMLAVVDANSASIAAIICEPIFQAANAMSFYNPQYLRRLRELCDERGILLIFDEIAAGFYRTGPRWAHERAGVAPDIMCIGKALTGGHITLAATVASERVASVISSGRPSAFMHGPTYMANPIACAAACASLELFAQSDYSLKVDSIEAQLRVGLAPLAGRPNVRDVRILGAVGIVELERMPSIEDIRRIMFETGVWLRPFCNFVYTMPPLVCDTATVAKICGAIEAVAKCEPAPGEPGDDDGFHE